MLTWVRSPGGALGTTMTQSPQPQPTDSERSRGARVVDVLDEIGGSHHLITLMAIIRHRTEHDGRCPSVADVRDRVEKIAGDRRDRRRVRQSLARVMDLGLATRSYAPEAARETYRYRLSDDGVVFAADLGLDRLASAIEDRDPTPDWIAED